MARLTSSARKSLPKSDFALPNAVGSKGKGMYPIDTPNRARNAESRVAQYGTPAEKQAVRAKVHAKFPSIGETSMKHEPVNTPKNGQGMQSRGHYETHRRESDRSEMSHGEFESLDHGTKHDHMPGRTKGMKGNVRVGLLAAVAAILIPLLALAAGGSAPYGVFGGAGTFAQLPGNIPLVFASAPTSTSGTLAVAWPYSATSELVVFSDWESRTVTFTNASTSVSWSGSLTGTPTVNATVDGFTTPPATPTFAFTSDLGIVWSNGTAWYATDNASGISATISSGCATVSAIKGTATAFQFATSGTTCTPVIQLPPAPNGWACFAQDVTHNVVFTQTASQTYSCTVTGTTTASDVVQVSAQPY